MRPDVVNCMVRRSYGKMKYWPQVRLLMILVVIEIGSSSLIAAEQFDRQVYPWTPIVQYGCGGQSDHEWEFRFVEDGVYQLINKKSGLCLAVGDAGSTKQLAPVVQYGCGGQEDHKWKLDRVEEGAYRLINKKSGLCLAVGDAGSTKQLAPIVQYGCGGQEDHKWILSNGQTFASRRTTRLHQTAHTAARR